MNKSISTTNKSPERIYLQYHGDASPNDAGFDPPADVTWCEDKVFDYDIEYIRADVAARDENEKVLAWLDDKVRDQRVLHVSTAAFKEAADAFRNGYHRQGERV